MSQAKLQSIYQHIVTRLEAGLPATLTYHCLRHTLDVLQQVERIAREEKVENEEELFLLQVSALYHDAGFLETYAQHEEKSQEIAQADLPRFGFNPAQLQTISGLILATKVPQQPQNKLQQILCDADLDYLGRDDFFAIGDLLYQEFLYYGVVTDEAQWDQLQVRFLESHRFFTCFSKNNREAQKQKHLQQIKARITQRT
jgi:predicted metal-dependent HD superfamily phosphohydrolase